jgi:hypothetical protein
MCAPVHEQPVEVQGSRLVAQRVEDIDDYPVANIYFDDRDRPLSIDAYDRPVCFAIWICCDPTDVEVVGHRRGPRKWQTLQKKSEWQQQKADSWGTHPNSYGLEWPEKKSE